MPWHRQWRYQLPRLPTQIAAPPPLRLGSTTVAVSDNNSHYLVYYYNSDYLVFLTAEREITGRLTDGVHGIRRCNLLVIVTQFESAGAARTGEA